MCVFFVVERVLKGERKRYCLFLLNFNGCVGVLGLRIGGSYLEGEKYEVFGLWCGKFGVRMGGRVEGVKVWRKRMRMEVERMRMMNLWGRGSLRGEEKGKLSGIVGRGLLCGGGGGGGVVLIFVCVESV